MLTLIAKLLHALNSENSSRQIALAVALAFIVGLSPLLSLHNLVILLLVLLIKVHLGSFIIALGGFKLISYLLSPLIVSVGESLLTSPSLQGLFTSLYQFDWFKLAHWHNTFTLGAFVIGCLLALAVYFIVKLLIDKYRQHIKRFFEQMHIVKVLKSSRIFSIYQQFSAKGDV